MNLLVTIQVLLKTRSTDMEENNNKEKLKEDSPSPLPQMGSENVTVGEPAMATGTRQDSSASASSHHSEDFGESFWRDNFIILKLRLLEPGVTPPQDLRRERPLKEEIENKRNKFCSVCQVR